MINAYVSGFVVKDYHTETANTVIDEEIPGQAGKRLALIGYEYTTGGVSVMSVMHTAGSALQRSNVTAAADALQKTIIVDDAMVDGTGAAMAASDIIAYEVASGWEFNTCASFSGGDSLVCGDSTAEAIAAGARIVNFGVVANNVSYKIDLGDSAANTSEYGSIYALAPYKGDPLYVTISNTVVAGKLYNMLWAYINK